ncbi:MAG: hypothetical protein K0U19_02140 [Proteobacteria bacterium]|nr:hypothetical protein [Pseudomonadota bacterium]
MTQEQFEWIPFFEEIADGLLRHKDDRTALVEKFHEIADNEEYRKRGSPTVYHDRNGYGKIYGQLKDIAPFTAIGLYLRVRNEKQRYAAKKLAKFLQVKASVPDCYKGVPSVQPTRSWFFASRKGRKNDDFEILWALLEKSINFSNKQNDKTKKEFIAAFDEALTVNQIARSSLTKCLFFVRPRFFPTLDELSFKYIPNKLGIPIKRVITGKEYLEIKDLLQEKHPKLSFAKISREAYLSR